MTVNMRIKCGFTIVELLVVVAVIGILAGILMTALMGAMRQADETVCMNNQKQIIVAWLMRAEDSQTTQNVGQTGANAPKVQTDSGDTWADTLETYVGGNRDLYKCPRQIDESESAYGFGMNPLIGGIWYYTHGMFGGGYLLTPGETRARPLSLVYNPGGTILLADTGWVTADTKDLASTAWMEEANGWKPYTAYNLTDTTSSDATSIAPINHGYDWGNSVPMTGVNAMGWEERVRAVPRHDGTCNTGYVDGHVTSTAIRAVTDPQWAAPACLFDNQPVK